MFAYPAGLPTDSTVELHFTTESQDWVLVTVEDIKNNAERLSEEYIRLSSSSSQGRRVSTFAYISINIGAVLQLK